MGCSAGKTLSTTSPEISTSTQHTNLPAGNNITKHDNKNGITKNGLVEEKRPSKVGSPQSNVNFAFRKNSASSTSSSASLDAAEKCLDTVTDNRQAKPQKQQTEQPKQKENSSQPRKLVHTKKRGDDDPPQIKSIPLGQVKVQLTQSQADFFTMLDKKIEEGEDYKSDCER